MKTSSFGTIRLPAAVAILLPLALSASAIYAEKPDSPQTLRTIREYFGVSEVGHPERRTRMEQYYGVCTTRPIKILVFDHEELKWSAYSWSGASERLEAARDLLSRTPDGNPKLIRGHRDQFLLFVVRTNPFLYSREGAVLPPVEPVGVADLKALASAIGSVVAGITAAALPTERSSVARLPQELEALYYKGRKSMLDLAELQQEMAVVVQKIEFSRGTTEPPFAPAEIDATVARVTDSLEELTKLHRGLVGDVRGCTAQWAVLGSLLQHDSISADDIKAARADLYKAAAGSPGMCSNPRPKELFEQLASSPSRKAEIEGKGDVKSAMLLLKIEDALSQRKNVEVALAQITNFLRTAEHAALGVRTPREWDFPLLNAGAAILNPPIESQHWDKDYPGTLSIKNDSSVCGDCSRTRREVEKLGFLLTSRRESFLGVGFGVSFTSIKNPTFGKVSIDPTTPTSGNVIGRTAEESRAGLVAVFGILRFRPLFDRKAQRGAVEPGAEFGAGVDPSKPAGFLGLSLELRKFVRIGVGGTWQSVTELEKGLTAAVFGPDGRPLPGTGSPVSADGDIRTRKHFTGRPYYSLVLSLDSLPFFQPKKS